MLLLLFLLLRLSLLALLLVLLILCRLLDRPGLFRLRGLVLCGLGDFRDCRFLRCGLRAGCGFLLGGGRLLLGLAAPFLGRRRLCRLLCGMGGFRCRRSRLFGNYRLLFLPGVLFLLFRLILLGGGLLFGRSRLFLLGRRFLFFRLGRRFRILFRTAALAFFRLLLRLFGSDGCLLVQNGVTEGFGIHFLGAFDTQFVGQGPELIFGHGIQFK